LLADRKWQQSTTVQQLLRDRCSSRRSSGCSPNPGISRSAASTTWEHASQAVVVRLLGCSQPNETRLHLLRVQTRLLFFFKGAGKAVILRVASLQLLELRSCAHSFQLALSGCLCLSQLGVPGQILSQCPSFYPDSIPTQSVFLMFVQSFRRSPQIIRIWQHFLENLRDTFREKSGRKIWSKTWQESRRHLQTAKFLGSIEEMPYTSCRKVSESLISERCKGM
jgi:hypothetical protein